jgi:hypothetical protein
VAKKKFKDGLESLFLDTREESASQKTPLLFDAEPEKPKKGRPSSGKHFSDDLEIFFQEALRDSIQDELAGRPAQQLKSPRTRPSAKPKDGLDALIRATIESSDLDLRYDNAKKRITISFDQKQIDKLKRIARLEKTLLKDMIAGVVAEYIRDYERNKGGLS